jgi:hypothetical protein
LAAVLNASRAPPVVSLPARELRRHMITVIVTTQVPNNASATRLG